MSEGSGIPRGDDIFTRRECRILAYKACGFSNSEVAEKMKVSKYTIDSQMHKILTHADARNVVQAVAIAFRDGYIGFNADLKLVVFKRYSA